MKDIYEIIIIMPALIATSLLLSVSLPMLFDVMEDIKENQCEMQGKDSSSCKTIDSGIESGKVVAQASDYIDYIEILNSPTIADILFGNNK